MSDVPSTHEQRVRLYLDGLKRPPDSLPLSTEGTIALIRQHLSCKRSRRLPALISLALLAAVRDKLRERVVPLTGHNAADEQTGAVGDVQITLLGDDQVVTGYEMKNKPVLPGDIDRALQKIAGQERRVHNYIFITTEPTSEEVHEYARTKYDETGGVEIAILDCIGFLRHFLHLFHRLRKPFLDHYQRLVLNEPASAVSQPMKEAFLALRSAAESAE